MDSDKGWERIVDAIDEKYGIAKHGRYKEPLEDKPELTAGIQFIEFSAKGKDFRLERVSKPAIIERKTIHHKAANSSVRFENIYDPSETTHKTLFFELVGGEQKPLNPEDIAATLA